MLIGPHGVISSGPSALLISFSLTFFDISNDRSARKEKLSSSGLVAAGPEELFEVVCCGHQEPFSSCFCVSSKTELSKPLTMLDLANRWFGDALSSGVEAPSLYSQELPFHPLLDCEFSWNRSSRRSGLSDHLIALHPLDGNVGIDALLFHVLEILFLDRIAGIGTERVRLLGQL